MLKMNSTDAVYFSLSFFLADSTSSATKAIHIYMWPTGDTFFMESRSCLSLCFSNPISQLRALLIEKESMLGGKGEQCWKPADDDTQQERSTLISVSTSSASRQHEPATLGSLEASIMAACGRAEGRERSEGGGQVEKEGERLSMFDILTHRFALQWQCFSRYLSCC